MNNLTITGINSIILQATTLVQLTATTNQLTQSLLVRKNNSRFHLIHLLNFFYLEFCIIKIFEFINRFIKSS